MTDASHGWSDPAPDVAGAAALAIMCKAPRPGRSKTRLAREIGPEAAARLSACFMRDVAAAIEALPTSCRARGYGLYAPADGEAEVRALLPPSFGLLLQEGADLGVALREGARALLRDHGKRSAILINSDSPTLPPRLLAGAVAALDRDGDRVVLGPATDGGYTLIGVKADHPELYRDVPWSTPDVLGATLRRAQAIGLPSELSPMWYDVDDAETLRLLVDELAGTAPPFADATFEAGRAGHTRAYLEGARLPGFEVKAAVLPATA